MRNPGLAFFTATFLVCTGPAVAWVLGADHGAGPIAPNDGGWPEEFREIFNRKDRAHGYFVNSGDVFFYAGGTKAFNGFLEQCAKLADADHELILHPGKAKVRSPWDKEDRDIKADWRLYADRRPRKPGKKYIVQVDLWLGGRISREDLKVPSVFTVRSAEEGQEHKPEEKGPEVSTESAGHIAEATIEIPEKPAAVTEQQKAFVKAAREIRGAPSKKQIEAALGEPGSKTGDEWFYYLPDNNLEGGYYLTARAVFENGHLKSLTVRHGHERKILRWEPDSQ